MYAVHAAIAQCAGWTGNLRSVRRIEVASQHYFGSGIGWGIFAAQRLEQRGSNQLGSADGRVNCATG